MLGTTLGPYRIQSELGAGGMGTVYAAEVVAPTPHVEVGTRVALKVIHDHLLETPGFFKRFLREAEVGRAVCHRNVVRTYDADALLVEGRQVHFLVMEYVQGQTLRDLLRELGSVPEELCRHIGRQVALGLAAIHEAGAVHRDVKPENVLITDDHVVKIMDLGVAQLQEESIRLSRTGTFLGSVHYAAPEQLSRRGVVDGRADLHALGTLLYELATGKQPFLGAELRETLHRILEETPRRAALVEPRLSEFFDALLQRLMAKDPDARFRSARELVRTLDDGESGTWWRTRARRLGVDAMRPLRTLRVPHETALRGREAELAQLHDLFVQARAGRGQIVLVEGEAGIGKSRLAAEFARQLLEDGANVNVLCGCYLPGGAATASGAFSTAFREFYGAADLETKVAAHLGDTPLLVPAFAALLLGEPTPRGEAELTKDTLQTAFHRVTRALAAERPTVLVVDDLHLAPEEGRALFAALAQGLDEDRVLLVGTTRRGLKEDWLASFQRLEHATRLVLPRLGAKDLGALLVDALGSRAVAEALSFLIADKSDGNPYFVFEILNGLREARLLERQTDGSWATTGVIRDIRIPSSVQELIAARTAELDDADRELLEVASCCGYEFDPEVVAEAAREELLPTLRRIGRIEKRHRLLRFSGRRCVFDHHQVQEVLYAGLLPQLREHYHLALGEALERRVGDAATVPGDVAVTLCEHLLASSEPARGLPYLHPALDHLQAGYLSDAVVRLIDRALGIPGLLAGERRARLLLRKSARLNLLGRPAENRAALDEALELAEGSPDVSLRALAHLSMARHRLFTGDSEAARAHFEEARARYAEAGDDDMAASAVGGVGTAYARLGRYEEARAHHEEHLRQARLAGNLGSEAVATGSLGSIAYYEGRYEEAREHYERDVALCRQTGHRSGEAAALENLAVALRGLGRHEESRKRREEALSLFRQIGDRRGEAIATGNLGNQLRDAARLEEALEALRSAIALCRTVGDDQTGATAEVNLATALIDVGRYEEAREHLRHALRESLAVGRPREEVMCLDACVRLDLLTGRLEHAHEASRRRLELWRQIGHGRSIAGALLEEAEILLAEGREEEARSPLCEAREMARTHAASDVLLEATARLAALGDATATEAETLLDEAQGALGCTTLLRVRWSLWSTTGDRTHLEEAYRLVEELRRRAPAGMREEMVERVALYRDVLDAWEREGARGS